MIITKSYTDPSGGIEIIREFDDEKYFYDVARVDERVRAILENLSEYIDRVMYDREANYLAHQAYLKADSKLKELRGMVEVLAKKMAFRTSTSTEYPYVINYPSRQDYTKVTAYDKQGREYEVVEGKSGFTLGQPTGKSRATFVPEV